MAQAVYDVEKDMRRDPFGTGRFLPSALEREARLAEERKKTSRPARNHGHANPPSQAGPSIGSPAPKPRILLLSLNDAGTFNRVHQHFLHALRARAEVIQAQSSKDLPASNVSAVYATDAALTEKKHSKLLAKVVEYVRSGGTFVIGGGFSSSVTGYDNNKFFEVAWGLDWQMGSCHRTTFALNPSRPERLLRGPPLAVSYSMKTVHLTGVPMEAVVYAPNPDLRLQSILFNSVTVTRCEVPVAYTQLGAGYLGYIGDVNGEEESTNVVLAMLGLPAETTPSNATPKKKKNEGKKKRSTRPRWGGHDYGISPFHREVLGVVGFDSDIEDGPEEVAERMNNGGYTDAELEELMCQGINPRSLDSD